jgi:hypothetical protein
MTTRERFQKVMNGDPSVDQSPVLEWATWWDKTLDFWEKEGMPAGMDAQALYRYFGLDSNIQFWFNTFTKECPRPSVLEHVIEGEEDYDRVRPHLLPDDSVEQCLDGIKKAMKPHDDGSALVWYTLDGYFWYTRELFGDEENLCSFYTQPELRRRISEDLLAWQLKTVDKFGKYIHVECVVLMSRVKGK